MTYMWQADPFKAKWTILAKAYSTIRDVQGKTFSPLDQFLAINTPLLSIIEPHEYLDALGWNVIAEADGHIAIQREDRHFDADTICTNISVNGVIENCYMQGYYMGRLSDVLLTNDETAFTITQSSPQAADDATAIEDTNPSAYHVETSDTDLQLEGRQDNGDTALESVSNDLPLPVAVGDVPVAGLSVSSVEIPQPVVLSAPAEPVLPVDFKLSAGQHALDEAFDPLLYQDQSVFDPFVGNQFDAFDWMDGWNEFINFDACA